MPYRREAEGWEGRIFPWEYVLVAATREPRRAASDGPRPLTVIRELQVQRPRGPGRWLPLEHEAVDLPPAGELRVLFVNTLPSELREHWTVADELANLRRVLPASAAVRCEIEPFAELNYAVLHNAQPLFRRFVLSCDAPQWAEPLDVEVAVHMGQEVARFQRRVQLRQVREKLTDKIHVPLTAEVARSVHEAINTSLNVCVRQGAEVLYHDSHRLRLLPVDQWRDNRRDGRWLPSFVLPRDPAVVDVVARAQRYNRVLRDDPTAGFEGYQCVPETAGPGPLGEAALRGVDRQVEAIWATLLHDWNLGYINPPPSYSGELDSQRLRVPSRVKADCAGTCIDLALLFAACLELVDIYPVVFLLDGHALPGWPRHPTGCAAGTVRPGRRCGLASCGRCRAACWCWCMAPSAPARCTPRNCAPRWTAKPCWAAWPTRAAAMRRCWPSTIRRWPSRPG